MALLVLLEGKSQLEAARRAGVHRNRIQAWLYADKYFNAAYHAGMKALATERMLAFGAVFRDALNSVIRLATAPKVKASVQFKAASYLLDRCFDIDEANKAPFNDQTNNTLTQVVGWHESAMRKERELYQLEVGEAFDRSPEGIELKQLEEQQAKSHYRSDAARDAAHKAYERNPVGLKPWWSRADAKRRDELRALREDALQHAPADGSPWPRGPVVVAGVPTPSSVPPASETVPAAPRPAFMRPIETEEEEAKRRLREDLERMHAAAKRRREETHTGELGKSP
ncbi:MAG: hypothetical protein IT462_15275 [Planctomycetes bacterium]|nr:hypothetical protein [Planctomycetota bacterium]